MSQNEFNVVLNVSVIIYCTYLYGQQDGLFGQSLDMGENQ